MVAIIKNKSVADSIIKNKDGRSESVDSFSSTIDAHDEARFEKRLAPASHDRGDVDDPECRSPSSSSPSVVAPSRRFGIAIEGAACSEDNDDVEDLRRRDACLSSILVLDSPSRPEVRALLDAHDGRLDDVGPHLLGGLRAAAPSRLAARVGDYNENLFYEMRDTEQDVSSIIARGGGGGGGVSSAGSDTGASLDRELRRDVEAFEESVRRSLRCANVKYRGSFMRTERTMYQPAHVDYDYPVLQAHGSRLFLAFFPLTEEGAFLQLWRDDGTGTRREEGEGRVQEGTVVYIPCGKMLIVPSDTIHGGGFKRGRGGNLRFHLYIDVQDGDDIEGSEEKQNDDLLHHPMNKYTERHDRRRELCERFVDASGLDSLLGTFFDV